MQNRIVVALILSITAAIFFLTSCIGGNRPPNDDEVEVLILMYHHITIEPEPENPSVISVGAFREQIETLYREGYSVVSFDDLIAFVDYGTELPRRAVIITFDDGHTSNLEFAAPILEEFGMSAIINIIGTQIGKSTYRHTYVRTIPHFALEEVLSWVERGVIHIGHHTYDMHWVDWIEETWSGADLTIPFRRGVLPLADETHEEWRAAFIQDFEMLRDTIYRYLGVIVTVYAYPYGLFTAETEEFLRELGVRVTLTTNPGINLVQQGNPNSLFALNRVNMEEDMTGTRLIRFLDSFFYE